MHNSQAKAVVDSVGERCTRCDARLESVSLASMGVSSNSARPPLIASIENIFEGTRDTVVIAGGEDVIVRRPISERSFLCYARGALGLVPGSKHKKQTNAAGGNGGFAIRNPAFVAEHGIQARPKVEGFKAWARKCGTMHHNDDVYLAIKMNELYVGSCVLRARPNAPATLLANFLST